MQQPKTTFFSSEEPKGVKYASVAGGTNIFIKGPELNENPQSNIVYFKSYEFNNVEIPGTPLDEDDAFNSNPMLGFITYRIPSPFDLFGVAPSAFDAWTLKRLMRGDRAVPMPANELWCEKPRSVRSSSFR